jgi:hypothetical protein
MSTYFYPNRPILVPPDPDCPLAPKPNYINGLEQSGKYVAEQKWNGDNCLVFVGKDGSIEFWNRHKRQLKYVPPPELLYEIRSQVPKDSIINGELLHSKTRNVKNLLMVHCIMKWNGKLLTGWSWGNSRTILEKGIKSGKHLLVSPVYRSGFWDLFQTRHGILPDGSILQDKDSCLIEGIVLKDPTGLLKYSTTGDIEVSWMLKIRHPSKKYSF